MDVMFDYSYLRGFIKEHYGTVSELAKELGLSASSVYDRLANKLPFTQREILLIKNSKNLSNEEVCHLFFKQK